MEVLPPNCNASAIREIFLVRHVVSFILDIPYLRLRGRFKLMGKVTCLKDLEEMFLLFYSWMC